MPLVLIFWRQQIYKKGLDPEPIAQKKFTVDNLALALSLLDNKIFQMHARKVQKQVLLENGMDKAVEILLTSTIKKNT